MFCYFWHNHHGDGLTAACLKVTGRDELDLLIEADPALYSWLPYLSPGGGWIGLCLADPGLDWSHVEARLLSSWRLAALAKRFSGMTRAFGRHSRRLAVAGERDMRTAGAPD